jgi:hypothetical protein
MQSVTGNVHETGDRIMTPGVAQLGDRVRDPITGFEGICVSVIQYMQGCERIGVLSENSEARCAQGI